MFFYKKIIHQCYAFLIIPLINLSMLFLCTNKYQNITGIGNELDNPFMMILWSVSAALYFYLYTKSIFIKYNVTNKRYYVCLLIACISMVLSTFIPYEPNLYPILSKWHVRIAAASTLGYLFLFLYFIFYLLKTDYLSYQKLYPAFFGIVILCSLYMILFGSVNILLEVSFTCCMSWYLYYFNN